MYMYCICPCCVYILKKVRDRFHTISVKEPDVYSSMESPFQGHVHLFFVVYMPTKLCGEASQLFFSPEILMLPIHVLQM